MKKIISIFLLICIVFGISTVATADEDARITIMTANYQKALKIWGRSNFYGYCAACVNMQLRAFGVNAGFVGSNGNTTYDYYSSLYKTSGGYTVVKYPSKSYTLSDVINFMNSQNATNTKFPVVIGYTKGTESAAGQRYGHTMMIYEVSGGYVYYTDSMDHVALNNIHKSGIDDFLAIYRDKPDTATQEFVFDGAVQFYKEKPITASLAINKDAVGLWESMEFRTNAPGCESYEVEVYRDGKLVSIIDGKKSHLTRRGFGEKGIYTAYVVAKNSYGTVKSEGCTFKVYTLPENPYIKVKDSEIKKGEQISLEFGADYTRTYCIGVARPDGSYKVEVTNNKNLVITADMIGKYTMYVTCCNRYGYVDSEKIVVNVCE